MGNSATRKKAATARQGLIRAKTSKLSLQENRRPRFIADVMLGRLAKWLRIAGFDVLYSNKFSDDELITISNGDGRILLSRDTRLLVRKSVKNFIFLESQNVQDQIRQTFEAIQVTSLTRLLKHCWKLPANQYVPMYPSLFMKPKPGSNPVPNAGRCSGPGLIGVRW